MNNDGGRIVRIGGEAELIRSDNETFFITTAPVRGFEKMVEGKSPIFVIEAVMRVCGICHAAHAITSCEAFEHALGIIPPRDAMLLREAAGLLNRVQSHLLHNIMIIPDILDGKHGDAVTDLSFEALEKVNKMLSNIAGAPTHPNRIVIGGIARPPSEKIIENGINEIKELLKIYDEIRKIEMDESLWSEEAKNAKKVEVSRGFLASHLFYGDRYAINVDGIDVIPYTEIHKEKEIAKKSTSNVALYEEKFVEVGPRARMHSYRGFSYEGIMGIQVARLQEMELSLKRIGEIFNQVDISQPVKTEGFIFRKGRGVGVYEAPRGTLVHKTVLNEDGRVESYKIIVPTMFNIPLMELTRSEFGIRLYDPCIPCSTHHVEVG
ncbi:MAG: nickel-dependent hydrogenase large subunit [Thermoplasmata archaeon]|nr:nickel-dependent hydrogenase large subunit [Thermoplasmata archaeon]